MSGSTGTTEKARSLGSVLGPLLFLTGIFFTAFLARVCMAPLMPVVEADLSISHAQAGSLFFFISLGYLISLFSSGFVSSRIGHRRTVMLSALAVGSSMLLLSVAGSVPVLSGCLLLVGGAAGLYLPSGIASLTELVDSRHWGRALAVHELAPNLAVVLAPMVAELLLGWMPWRGVLACLGVAALALGLFYGLWGRGGDFYGQPPNLVNLAAMVRRPGTVPMMLLFSLGVAASLGVYMMLPLYLVSEHGMDRSLANLLVGSSRVAGIGMSFVSGWVVDRLGPRTTLGWVLGAGGAATVLLGLARGDWLLVPLFLQPAVAVCFFPAAFAVLSHLGDASQRNLAVSAVVPLSSVVGIGLIPWGIGYLGETASFAWGIGLTGLLVASGLLLLPRLAADRE